jgi:glycosyltransferase involved in cell wall biosynthesis
LITAFGRLGGDVHLFLAGDGERRAAIELLVESSGLADRVHFLGNVADVRPLLKATDVSVLASTAVETFSIAMLESFAMGVPMVAPDIGGLSEAIFQGRTGWIFPAGDADGLTGLLEQAVHDRERLKAMGGHARALVEQKFSKEVMADAMTGLLHDVASGDS